MRPPSSNRPFYGWYIVFSTFVTLFISVGFLFYSYGVFFPALEADFGGSRFAIATGLALMNLCIGLSAPFLGRIIDTWSIRNVMMIGGVSMAVGFVAASQITALWQFYVLLGTFLGLGASMIGQLPSSTLVSNWFIRRRGTALGFATMGVSMSGMVMAPVTTTLITNFGWRTTFVIFGALAVAIVLPLVRLIVVNRPEDMGLRPDGAAEPAVEMDETSLGAGSRPLPKATPHYPDFSTAGTARNPNFWAIALVIGSNFFILSAVLVHMVPHARDLGFSPLRASYVLTASAGVGVIGKVVFGYIADFVDTRAALLLCMLFQALGVVLLLFAESYPVLLVVGAVFGFGMGGVVPLWGSLIGEYFGQRSFGRVMGLMTPCMLPLQVSGVPFAGLVFDTTGRYDLAFETFLGLHIIASFSLLILRRPSEDTALGKAASSVASPVEARSD